ncbi:hypothetical protein BC628DRAFT_421783 [Trametes gibbosa]|nr:hypothetical protein BC628DRAFT_421783 [Trametes gibbosa]
MHASCVRTLRLAPNGAASSSRSSAPWLGSFSHCREGRAVTGFFWHSWAIGMFLRLKMTIRPQPSGPPLPQTRRRRKKGDGSDMNHQWEDPDQLVLALLIVLTSHARGQRCARHAWYIQDPRPRRPYADEGRAQAEMRSCAAAAAGFAKAGVVRPAERVLVPEGPAESNRGCKRWNNGEQWNKKHRVAIACKYDTHSLVRWRSRESRAW